MNETDQIRHLASHQSHHQAATTLLRGRGVLHMSALRRYDCTSRHRAPLANASDKKLTDASLGCTGSFPPAWDSVAALPELPI